MADVFTLEFDFRNTRFTKASVGLEAFARGLKRDWDGSTVALSRELRAFLDTVAQALASRHSAAWPGGTGATTLSKRSGNLAQSIIQSVQVTGGTLADTVGTIGSDMIYARIQEFGGTIHAKNAQFLTIPLPAALDSSGLPLKSKARDWPNTFCRRSKAGNLIIFQTRGTSIVPLYVLKESVVIPPRLGMGKMLQAGMGYFVDRAADAIVRELRAK